MRNTPAPLLVTYKIGTHGRGVIEAAVRGAAPVVYLDDLTDDNRGAILREAAVLLSRNVVTELQPAELACIAGAKLLQFVTAGVDFIAFSRLPPELPAAANGGGYSEPMAEHGLAMALACAKRLRVEQLQLEKGVFNQFVSNKMLAGGVCGILGFGGIGVATARLMRGIGMKVHAVNRRGSSDEPVDWIGTTAETDRLLGSCDVLILSLPLTRSSEGMIDAAALGRMKKDAVLINLARGEIVDEKALYEHLVANPDFSAGIDAWWIEPIRHGEFRMNYPFLDLPNVVASPHNSASVAAYRDLALQRAVENCRRVLVGEAPLHLVGADERRL